VARHILSLEFLWERILARDGVSGVGDMLKSKLHGILLEAGFGVVAHPVHISSLVEHTLYYVLLFQFIGTLKQWDQMSNRKLVNNKKYLLFMKLIIIAS
jgi:hypothetical protein